MTDASGKYNFTGLNPGEEYQVTFNEATLPTDYQFTKTDVGSDETADSDADSSGVTAVVTLTSGEDNPTIDAGIYQPASLGNQVFFDTDGDGIRGTGESGVSGVTVTLVGGGVDGVIADNPATTSVDESADNSTATAVTNASGKYGFSDLNPGEEYQVTFDPNTLPEDHQFALANAGTDEAADSDADASGVTPIVTLSSGEDNTSIDAGIVKPASLGDTVFFDNNGDGIQDSGESGVANVTVTLTGGGADGVIADNPATTSVDESADNSTATTITDASGNYGFSELNPGEEYQVTFNESTLPFNHQFTTAEVGTDETADSDANASGVTPIVTLSSGEDNPTIDAGIYQLASLGDKVFLDNNGDGFQDSGESGVSGVTVTLTGGGADGDISTTTDNTTATVATDADGNYSFTGLTPGEEYQVTFDSGTLPTDAKFTKQDIFGNSFDPNDSDANESGVTSVVTLSSGENNEDIDAGILQPASLGDTVFIDSNNNGIQDGGESGVSGVTVTLVGGGADGDIATTGDNTTETTTTDASGKYGFSELNPGEEYQVSFDESTLPANHQFIQANVGSDETADSDADASGVTPIVTLTSGENNPDIDAGILAPASLGDTVFLDIDGDGIQDSGESGVSGITVTLVGGGADGLIDDNTSTTGVEESADNTTVTTSTDSSGTYSFTGLNPGEEYQVTFEESSLPTGAEFTDTNAGTDTTADSDADASGVTPIVTLTSGENNPDIDAGILQTASLGDTVFFDTDGDGIQDSGESGVANVTVTLVGGGADGLIDDNTSTTGVDESVDNTITTAVTDASGKYGFSDLNPGEEYQVTFEESTLPANHQFTTTDAGTDETADSDADASGVTPIVTLTSGENNPDIDAGILQTASLGDTVFLDNDGDGIQNSGESGVSGITVTLVGGGADGLIDDNTSTTGVDESAESLLLLQVLIVLVHTLSLDLIPEKNIKSLLRSLAYLRVPNLLILMQVQIQLLIRMRMLLV